MTKKGAQGETGKEDREGPEKGSVSASAPESQQLYERLTLVAIAVFLWALPPLALVAGYPGQALVLGALGLVVDGITLRRLLASLPRRGRGLVLGASVAAHLVVVVAGGFAVLRPPPGGWERLAGTEQFSDMTLLLPADQALLVLQGGEVFERTSEGFRPLSFPGGVAWEMGEDRAIGVWVAPRDEPRIYFFTPHDVRWRAWPRPEGFLGGVAATKGVSYVVASRWLAVGRPGDDWTGVGEEGCTDVAAEGDTILVVGTHWLESTDAGLTWNDVTPQGVSLGKPRAAVGGGWRYAFEGGRFGGALLVGAPGEPFEARSPPARDLRALMVNPDDGSEVWAATGGRGVFRSLDGGRSWIDFGIQGVSVSSIAADWARGRIYAASASLFLNRGVYARSFVPRQAAAPNESE